MTARQRANPNRVCIGVSCSKKLQNTVGTGMAARRKSVAALGILLRDRRRSVEQRAKCGCRACKSERKRDKLGRLGYYGLDRCCVRRRVERRFLVGTRLVVRRASSIKPQDTRPKPFPNNRLLSSETAIATLGSVSRLSLRDYEQIVAVASSRQCNSRQLEATATAAVRPKADYPSFNPFVEDPKR